MNPVPASVKAARLPQVNLVPPEIALRRARGRQRFFALMLLVVFVLGLGAAAVYFETVKAGAEDDLAEATAEFNRLQAEAAAYSDVPRVLALLNNAEDARAYAGATEFDYSDFLTQMLVVLPDGARYESITFSATTFDAEGSPDTGPFTRPDLGSVTLSGWSETEVDASALADSLEDLIGLERVRVNVTTRTQEEGLFEDSDAEGELVYAFTINARITIEALTGRFAPEVTPVAEAPADENATEDTDSEGDA